MANRHWHEKPLRITQTVLREVDAVDYDAAAVVDYLRQSHSNCLVVNAGGIFDFFPSPLPCANPIPQLGGRDVLREISTACREAGIRVICRVDFRGVEQRHWEQHPDWFATEADGGPVVRQDQSLRLYAPCYESFYRNEHAEAFIGHLLSEYPVDGIWHNAVLIRGTCHCERCRERYREEAGGGIPAPGATAEEMERYWSWKARSAHRNLTRLRDAVKAAGPDKAYVAEVFSMFNVDLPRETGIDLYDAREFFDFLVVVAFLTENREWPEYRPLEYAGTVTRFLKALDPARQPVLLWGGNGTSHRFIIDPPVDSRIWLWEGLGLGSGFWNCLFNGQHPGATHDRRNAMIGRDAYEFLETHEAALDGQVPVEDVTVLYSKPSKDLFGSDDDREDAYCTAVQGVDRVLVQEHVPYGFLTEIDLSAERLSDVRVLIAPNAACLSDAQCETLRSWVTAGGRLIATFETSLYDEEGNRRPDFGLADLFGCSHTGDVVPSHVDCYQSVEDAEHPILQRFGDTKVLNNGSRTVLARLAGGTAVCRYVPIILNQPPERAWRAEMASEYPTVVVNHVGQGQVVYFANQVDRLCFIDGHPDFHDLLIGAVSWLLDGRGTLATNAPPSVHALLTRRGGDWVLSLVNHTAGPTRPVRALVPVRDITVELAIGRPKSHQVLRSEGRVRVSGRGGKTVVTVDRLDEFCAVSIDTGEG